LFKKSKNNYFKFRQKKLIIWNSHFGYDDIFLKINLILSDVCIAWVDDSVFYIQNKIIKMWKVIYLLLENCIN